MRRAPMAVLLIALVAAWPVHAQATTERTLIDATLYVAPPNEPGLCFPLGPGQLKVTVRRSQDATEQRPTLFSLDGLMPDPETHILMRVTGAESVTETHVNGSDRYCWQIAVNAPEAVTMPRAQAGAYVQTVDVRITHRPDWSAHAESPEPSAPARFDLSAAGSIGTLFQ